MLVAAQISVKLASRVILDDLSLTLAPGKFYSILGPNGAGKSTLLKALSGDVDAVKDKIKLSGKTLSEYTPLSLAAVRSVMPQSVYLDFPFLVSEIIEMSRVEKSVNDEQAILKALSLFDVAHLVDRNYLTLSGGEQQRVQLARVVNQISSQHDESPKYLFLDECTANLDIAHQHQVFETVKRMVAKQNLCAVVVSHDLNLASQYSDEIMMMKSGEILAKGKPETVLTKGLIQSVYDFSVEIILHPNEMNHWPVVLPAS